MSSLGLQYINMQEKKQIITRQNSLQIAKAEKQAINEGIAPFILQRQQYKQLIIYQKKGHWSQKQKLKYAIFLEHYKDRFQIRAKRRFNNIFDIMAVFIKTRNPHQCRSHHQKMQKQKFKIDSIIANTASKYHPRIYKQLKDRYIDEIRTLREDQQDNFEKFKQRIQKIEQKKAVQRQIFANNRRILRSSRAQKYNQQRRLRKLLKNQRRLQMLKAQQQPLKNDKTDKKELHLVKSQQQQRKYEIIQSVQIQKQQTPLKIMQQNPVPLTRQFSLFPRQIMVNQINMASKNQILQNRKKQHLDLAYIHYNEYMKHVNQANNIHFQIMRQNSLGGNFNVF